MKKWHVNKYKYSDAMIQMLYETLLPVKAFNQMHSDVNKIGIMQKKMKLLLFLMNLISLGRSTALDG